MRTHRVMLLAAAAGLLPFAASGDDPPDETADVDTVIIVVHSTVPNTTKIGIELKVKYGDDLHTLRGDNFRTGNGVPIAALDAPSGDKIRGKGKPKITGDSDKVKIEFEIKKNGAKMVAVYLIKPKPAEKKDNSATAVSAGNVADTCSGLLGSEGTEMDVEMVDCEPSDVDACLNLSCEES